MRPTLIMFSLAAVIAACSDNDQTTSPRTAQSAAATSTAVAVAAAPGVVVSQAKPTTPTAFTKVTFVTGTPVDIGPGQADAVYVLCPVGTMAIGGTYTVAALAGPRPYVDTTHIGDYGNQTGWVVGVDNFAGTSKITVNAAATCIS